MKNESIIKLAKLIRGYIVQGISLSHDKLYDLAKSVDHFTDRTILWDACQIAMNEHIIDQNIRSGLYSNCCNDERALKFYLQLNDAVNLLPTHNARTDQQLAFQQFSTPPHYAYLASYAANIGPEDIVLEPSAGLLGLAIFAAVGKAKKIWVNEMEPHRHHLLQDLIAQNTDIRRSMELLQRRDAKQIYLFDRQVQATVVLMNPPFSSEGATGVSGKFVATSHIEAAMHSLVFGGRLVAIVPGGIDEKGGLHFAAPSQQVFWAKMYSKYNVRANIGIPPKIYKKFGTEFPTRLVVIDKTGSTKRGEPMLIDKIANSAEIFPLLAQLRKDRPKIGEIHPPRLQKVEPLTAGDLRQALETELDDAEMVAEREYEDRAIRANLEAEEVQVEPEISPLQKRYLVIKESHPEAIILIRTGDWYNTIGEDAVLVSTICHTKLDKYPGTETATATFHHNLLDQFMPKLVAAGFKVAICDEQEPELEPVMKVIRNEEPAAEPVQPEIKVEPEISVEWEVPKISTNKLIQNSYEFLMRTKPGNYMVITEGDVLEGDFVYNRGIYSFSEAREDHIGREVKSMPMVLRVQELKTETAIPMETAPESSQPDPEDIDDVFTGYTPYLFHPLAKKHPAPLVESEAMSSVKPPKPTAKVWLPKQAIESGRISDAQLESVMYQAHAAQRVLPSGLRVSTLEGGGTGFGKGTVLAANALNYYFQGKKRFLWVSKTSALLKDARRDWRNIGGDPLFVFPHENEKDKKISRSAGILFTTYSMVARRQALTESQVMAGVAETKLKGVDRFNQICEWDGQGPEVILLDESHEMGNSTSDKGLIGTKKASKKALQMRDLIEKQFPGAIVVMASATSATEAKNLAYAAPRLGLAGPHMPAFQTETEFITKVDAAGTLVMELLAKDMKSLGLYRAPSLSYAGTSFEVVEHELTPKQEEMYDQCCEAWQLALQYMDKMLEVTGQASDPTAKGQARSQFFGTMQRFFNQLLTSMKMPTGLAEMQKDLDNGMSVVIQLVNTEEAATDRGVEKALKEGYSFDEMDITPKDALMNLIRDNYPTIKYVHVGEGEYKPLTDDKGNFIHDPEAEEMKQELLYKIADIRVPQGALDYILEYFGAENVAEVTGRSKRYVRNKSGNRVREGRTRNKVDQEINDFMDGKIRVLVFSNAGNTGRSFQADLDRINQERRAHWAVQVGWIAAEAFQGFGRTHRTNQRWAPAYKLLRTNRKAEKRFITTIARKLEQLGALTKGNRKSTGRGMFSAADNLEGPFAFGAVREFFELLRAGHFEKDGLDYGDVIRQMGYEAKKLEGYTDDYGTKKPEIPPVTQFLNRIMALKCRLQDMVFDKWFAIMEVMIDHARERGSLDVGVEQLYADSITIANKQLIYKNPDSGAKSWLVELKTKFTQATLSAEDLEKGSYPSSSRFEPIRTSNFKFLGYFRNTVSKKVYGYIDAGFKTNAKGEVEVITRRVSPTGSFIYYESELLELRDKKKGDVWIKDLESGRKAWQKEIDAVEPYREQSEYLLTGSIFPIWDKIASFEKGEVKRTNDEEGQPKSTEEKHVRVISATTTDTKERMIGRLLDPELVGRTLQNLGVSRDGIFLTPEEMLDKLNAGYSLILSNGNGIEKRIVSRLERLLVTGLPVGEAATLSEQGIVRRDMIGNRPVVYLHEDDLGQIGALMRYLQNRPATYLVSPEKVETPLLRTPRKVEFEAEELEEAERFDISELVQLVDYEDAEFLKNFPGLTGIIPSKSQQEDEENTSAEEVVDLFTVEPAGTAVIAEIEEAIQVEKEMVQVEIQVEIQVENQVENQVEVPEPIGLAAVPKVVSFDKAALLKKASKGKSVVGPGQMSLF